MCANVAVVLRISSKEASWHGMAANLVLKLSVAMQLEAHPLTPVKDKCMVDEGSSQPHACGQFIRSIVPPGESMLQYCSTSADAQLGFIHVPALQNGVSCGQPSGHESKPTESEKVPRMASPTGGGMSIMSMQFMKFGMVIMKVLTESDAIFCTL